jgi:1,4-dihydroxy-2-naphthoate octaprenyltransferase
MLKGIKKTPFTMTLFFLSFVGTLLIDIFSVNFSSVFFILFGALCGVVVYLVSKRREDK